MIGDLVAVIQPQIIPSSDGPFDIMILDIFIEGGADQKREEWLADALNVEVQIPKRVTEIEINKAVNSTLLEFTAKRDGTDRQRVNFSSDLIGKDIRIGE